MRRPKIAAKAKAWLILKPLSTLEFAHLNYSRDQLLSPLEVLASILWILTPSPRISFVKTATVTFSPLTWE